MGEIIRPDDTVLEPMEAMAVRRVLELLESGSAAPGGIYNNPFDANWLGFGVGFCRAHGFIKCVESCTYDLSEKGTAELQRLRGSSTAPRLPTGLVPTQMGLKSVMSAWGN